MTDLSRLIRQYEASEEASIASREEAERAWDYYDARQLTSEEEAALKKRKQPPVIENLVRPKIDSLCGLERQSRTDPHCYPRTLGDEEAAQVATDALRYVADDQRLDVKRSDVFRDMLIKGFGGVEVVARKVRDATDPEVIHVPWDRLFFDPHSSQPDFSDAMYLGFVTWMDVDEAKERWGKEDIIDAAMARGTSDLTETYDDKPKWAHWADTKRKRVRIVTMYYREKGWNRVVFTVSGELEPCAPSPWLDEDGRPDCGLIMQSAFVDRDNDRYGLVRDLFSLQDEVNKRRSKFLHLANSSRIRASRAFEGNKEALRKEMARPDGVLIADKDEIDELGNSTMAAGHFQLLAEAKQAIAGTGPNAHMQGKEGNDQSGRAILAMQQAGMIEMAPLLDGLRDFNLRVFRAIWCRIRQFWSEERWIRVTEDENAVKFFAVNTTKATVALQKIGDAANNGMIDQQTALQYVQRVQMDPAMTQPANVVAELDVDIQIDEVMNTPTLHAEQFQELSNMAQAGVFGMPVPTDIKKMLIQASNLRDKNKLIEMLDKAEQASAQANQQQQQMAQQGMMIELAGKEADAQLKGAKAQETQVKTALMVPQMQMDAMRSGFQAGA